MSRDWNARSRIKTWINLAVVFAREIVQTMDYRAVDRNGRILSDCVYTEAGSGHKIALVGQMARRAAVGAGRITQVVSAQRSLCSEERHSLALSRAGGERGVRGRAAPR
jgi:hypothetical protein